MTRNVNKDLGADDSILQLVERIQAFNYNDADNRDLSSLARAIKVLAQDLVERHASARALEAELVRKTAIADVAGELAEVYRTIAPSKPAKRGFFTWGSNP
ncbi:hypothetical protein UFOVP55_50 [uncultured Caudovirales phage]|jgi:hypothetical protein|uniref:Uncharacterized protein n=1 Tax=uncultured Caudovirales phage TaxID=2100421 RepID=A0A6J5KVM8_9CAUD|nr:hypothetical protein UFOVP55_50 [uncultured Caudovirales phage]